MQKFVKSVREIKQGPRKGLKSAQQIFYQDKSDEEHRVARSLWHDWSKQLMTKMKLAKMLDEVFEQQECSIKAVMRGETDATEVRALYLVWLYSNRSV